MFKDERSAALCLIREGDINVNEFSKSEIDDIIKFAKMYYRGLEITKIYDTFTKDKTLVVFKDFDDFCNFIKKKIFLNDERWYRLILKNLI